MQMMIEIEYPVYAEYCYVSLVLFVSWILSQVVIIETKRRRHSSFPDGLIQK